MRAAALVMLLTVSSCFTTIGAGAGAGIGYLVGSPVQGAVYGGLLGLRADIAMAADIAKFGRSLIFWM